jgi:Flp pilus assembly pilin Flp
MVAVAAVAAMPLLTTTIRGGFSRIGSTVSVAVA